jgi:hypothetical protein
MDLDSDSTWSDTADEDDSKNRLPLRSRAYQIEMFEASLKENIVAVVSCMSNRIHRPY